MVEEIEFAESKAAGQGAQNNDSMPSDGFMNIPDGIENELPFN